MKIKTNYFLLGLFVIAGLAAVGAGIFTVGATAFASRGLLVESYFLESVQGLEKGALVRFRGVRIGVVTDIRLVSQLYSTSQAYAAVRYLLDPTDASLTNDELRERLDQRVAQGYRVRLGSQGLTGALYLETDLVEDPVLLGHRLDIDWTPEHPYVPSVPSRIARIGTSVEEVLTSLERTDFAGLVEEGRDTLTTLRELLESLDAARFQDDLAALNQRAQATVDDARDQLHSSGERLDAVLERITAIAEAVEPAQVRSTVDALAAFAAGLPETRAQLDRAIASVRVAADELRGEVRTKGRDADLILGELRRASTHIANLADTLERYPSLLMIGNPPRRAEPGK